MDVQINREILATYPLIQIFKFSSDRHRTNRFVRNIFVAVQVNAADGETAMILGETIEDIMTGKIVNLTNSNTQKVQKVSVTPVEFIMGKSVPSNVIGVHCYQTTFRLTTQKLSQ